MPAYQSSKSRIAKSPTKQGFKFRWWMGLILVAIVAGIGIYILRFSHAATVLSCANQIRFSGNNKTTTLDSTFNCSQANQTKNAPQLATLGYTSQRVTTGDAYLQEKASSVFGPDNGKLEIAKLKVCWSFVNANTSPGGKKTYFETYSADNYLQNTNSPLTVYAAGTTNNQCGETLVAELKDLPNSEYSIKYRIMSDGGEVYGLSVSREVLAIQEVGKATPPGSKGTTPGKVTAPPTPPNPNLFNVTINGATLLTTCGSRTINTFQGICNVDDWKFDETVEGYEGYNWHDVGVWRWHGGNTVCGRKSIPFLGLGTFGGFWIVACPSPSDAKPLPPPTGTINVTKYGPDGPFPPNAFKRSPQSAIPGNTSVCLKNKQGTTFGCSTDNPFVAGDILVGGSPYQAYVTPPSGWHVSRTLLNNQEIPKANQVSFDVKQNQTTYVAFYFDQ